MIVRMAGVLFIILGLVALRNLVTDVNDRFRLRLDSLLSDNPSVAGVMTDIMQSRREVYLFTTSGMHSVYVEEASSAEEKRRGLMYRESLCEECGMLFLYEEDVSGGYWMKNCKIPLDIIFVSEDKEVVDFKADFQPCISDPCPSYRPSSPYRYVLEVNGGWVLRHDLEIGDDVSL